MRGDGWGSNGWYTVSRRDSVAFFPVNNLGGTNCNVPPRKFPHGLVEAVKDCAEFVAERGLPFKQGELVLATAFGSNGRQKGSQVFSVEVPPSKIEVKIAGLK